MIACAAVWLNERTCRRCRPTSSPINEAEKIADAVASVLWADEIVVADSGSTDRTAEIAQRLGARVVQIPFDGFGDLRNRAIAECRHDWIFSLDSDERCTPEVRDEILSILAAGARTRRLSGAAPQLHDGALDQGVRLVSEFPPAAALPQGRDALRRRAGARGLRAPDPAAGRAIARARSGSSRSAISRRSSAR